MKSAIYIESGTTQFVLTPESEIDKQVLDQIERANGLSTCRGSFYETRGGWIRYREHHNNYYNDGKDQSLIFLVRETKPEESAVLP